MTESIFKEMLSNTYFMYFVTLFSNIEVMGFIAFTAAGHQGAAKIFGFTVEELSYQSHL